MIVVLAASAVPPIILGRLKLRLAGQLHDKTLKADADMNKADWQIALAGMVGILGVGLGYWWADAAAGPLISASIVKDGAKNLRDVVANLMDGRPVNVDGRPSQVPEEVLRRLQALPSVLKAELRLREEGHVFTGELFLHVRECRDLAGKIREARRVAEEVDWRVHDLVVEITEA